MKHAGITLVSVIYIGTSLSCAYIFILQVCDFTIIAVVIVVSLPLLILKIYFLPKI